MSVDRIDYIVYGYKLPYKLESKTGEIDIYDDKFLPMVEGHKGEEFTLISDGMYGDYNVFGLLISDDQANEWEGWNFTQLDFKNLDPEKVKQKYRELFDPIDEIIPEPTLFIFSHFS